MKTPSSRSPELPLLAKTPDEWARQALRDPLALLNDHAHLEGKAAANALELLHRWPEPTPPENWVLLMTAVARDEVDHLATVTRILTRRGGRLTRSHRNVYASALRDLVRRGDGPCELVDRLLVSALIEARSCERFEILSRHCEGARDARATEDARPADRELAKLYRELWSSEHGHFLVFLNMAKEVRPPREVERRWQEMLEAEAKIIRAQPPGPRMHSWVE